MAQYNGTYNVIRYGEERKGSTPVSVLYIYIYIWMANAGNNVLYNTTGPVAPRGTKNNAQDIIYTTQHCARIGTQLLILIYYILSRRLRFRLGL